MTPFLLRRDARCRYSVYVGNEMPRCGGVLRGMGALRRLWRRPGHHLRQHPLVVLLAILGALVLPPTAAVLAIADRGLVRWKRVAAITVGIIVPAAAVLLFLASLAALDQLN